MVSWTAKQGAVGAGRGLELAAARSCSCGGGTSEVSCRVGIFSIGGPGGRVASKAGSGWGLAAPWGSS